MESNAPGIDGQVQMNSLPGVYAPGFAFYVAGDYSALTFNGHIHPGSGLK